MPQGHGFDSPRAGLGEAILCFDRTLVAPGLEFVILSGHAGSRDGLSFRSRALHVADTCCDGELEAHHLQVH